MGFGGVSLSRLDWICGIGGGVAVVRAASFGRIRCRIGNVAEPLVLFANGRQRWPAGFERPGGFVRTRLTENVSAAADTDGWTDVWSARTCRSLP